MKIDSPLAGIKRIILDNGLRILFAKGPKSRKNVVMVGFNVGSAYENDENAGLFHFLEHILFKSTKTKKCKQILEELESEGTIVNAFTCYHQTYLYAKMLPHLTIKTLQSFFELVANPEYNAKEVEIGKKAILEEMENSKDDHGECSNDLFLSSLFPNQYFARSIVGHFHTIKAIGKADLEEAKKKYYIPNNMVIVVVGKFDEEKVLIILNDTFGKMTAGVLPSTLPKIGISNSQTMKMIPRDSLRSQAYLCLGYKVPGSNHKDYQKITLLNYILSSGMSSRLFIALREKKGIGYEINTELVDFEDIALFYVCIPGFYKKRLSEAVKIILGEFQNLKKKTVSIAELERAKSRFLSDYEESLDKPEDWAMGLLENELFGSHYDFRKFARYVKRVNPKDIQKAAQEYLTDDYTLTALLPKGFTPFK